MDSDPSFSVILPVYNRESTLDRCLTSIAAQRYRPFEVIAVDDGSRDASAETVSKWRDRMPNLRLIRQKNSGVAAARNAAIAVATGNWLAFIDSDDEWNQDKLEKFAMLIKEDPKIDMLHSDRLAPDGSTRTLRRPDVAPQAYQERHFLLSEWVVMTSTVAVRRETASGAGAFVEKLYSCSDYEWFWRVICISRRIKYVPVPLTIVHDGPPGMARKFPEQVRIHDNLRTMASSISWREGRPDAASKCSIPLRRWRVREFKQLIRVNTDQRRYLVAMLELGKYLGEYITGRFLYLPVSRKAR